MGLADIVKKIKNDAQALIDAGFNVQINSAKGHADSYCYIEKNDFDAAEIKMLLDAVAAARFLSDDKCNLLIKKLKTLTCTTCADVMTLEGRPSRIHKEGNSLFQVVDVLEYAISKKLRVSFQYYDYDMNLKKVLHNDGEVYTFSPYSFKWEQDRYYILGMVDKRLGIINPFRVDLICNIKLIDAEIVPPPADFVPADYSNKVFKMYGGTKADVIMEADPFTAFSRIQNMIDEMPKEFNGTLEYHMERLGWTNAKLAEECRISERTVTRLLANPYPNAKVQTIIALCLGMKLDPQISHDLIRKSYVSLPPTDECNAYRVIVDYMYLAGIEACNNALIQHGFEPLPDCYKAA